LFHAAEEQHGQRIGNSPCLRACHSWVQRTHLKLFLGSSGWASNTVPGDSFNLLRFGFVSRIFIFVVLMVVG